MITAVDLFAGAGGWDLAALALEIDVHGIELDPSACATRRAAGLATTEGDVRAYRPRDFPAQMLIASPPCQTFSMAGRGAGRADLEKILAAVRSLDFASDVYTDERTGLILEPLRWAVEALISDTPYEWIALEQVPTVAPVWAAYADMLTYLGYTVATEILNAEQYGVPQTRRRAVLVARLGGEGTDRALLPAPTHSRYYSRDKARLDPGVLPWISMADALGWGDGEMVGFPRQADGLGEAITIDGIDYRARDLFGAAAPAQVITAKARSWQRFGAAPEDWMLQNNTSENAARRSPEQPAPTMYFGARLNSMHWVNTRPATTVNGDPRISRPGRHDPNESGSQQRGAIRVTQAEAAVLQTFPADYPWQGSRTAQFQQIGNAIPPRLAGAVLSSLLGSRAPTYRNGAPSRKPTRRELSEPAPTIAFGNDMASCGWEFEVGARTAPGFLRLSMADAAVLQSFPPNYPWQGCATTAFGQLANAVPPRLAGVVLAALVGEQEREMAA